ncbi:serine hydrolase [Spirochaeta lutea]|uniref:Beta-lactamase class A catalytic domain-containing protein n=1 Tax=Spirochaeta lutea TaxID=1480694 RepID=A0A098QZY2_9SPIO|nr:serine hydrolase [Spirochaeta lutea]KGE72047.1 hypothetical protein DC28_08025 [Spirochaeta lutea]
MNTRIWLVGLVALGLSAGLAHPVSGQTDDSREVPMVEQMARRVAASFLGQGDSDTPAPSSGGDGRVEAPEPVNPGDFHPDFLVQVPFTQIQAIFGQYGSQLGRVDRLEVTRLRNTELGDFALFFSQGFKVPMVLGIAAPEDPRITTLWLGNPAPVASGIQEIVDDVAALEGNTSLIVTAHPGGEPVTALNAGEVLNIGSTMKLFILSALADRIHRGQASWEDIVELRPKHRSLPSGFLHTWSEGAPFTLYSLAGLMISQSDNTATDILLDYLGPEAVEEYAMTHYGVTEASLPILSTRQLFQLKADHRARERFKAAPTAAQRRQIASQLGGELPDASSIFPGGRPVDVGSTGYLGTTASLQAVMTDLWLENEDERVREILSINPGIALDEQRVARIGYKGGSEPGAINMTLGVEAKNGRTYIISATWNNPSQGLNESRFVGLIQGLVDVLSAVESP